MYLFLFNFLITLTEKLIMMWETDLHFTILLHIWITALLLPANLSSHDHTLPDNVHRKIFNIFQDVISLQTDNRSILLYNYKYLVRDICFPSLTPPPKAFWLKCFHAIHITCFFFFVVIILYMKTIKIVYQLLYIHIGVFYIYICHAHTI